MKKKSTSYCKRNDIFTYFHFLLVFPEMSFTNKLKVGAANRIITPNHYFGFWRRVGNSKTLLSKKKEEILR